MKIIPLSLQGAYIVEPEVYNDERGSFFRFFSADEFEKIGLVKPWLQLNHSITKLKHSVRGLHFQLPPHAEIKMVKCIAGAVFDVMVDLRAGSKTFLQWTGVEISAENRKLVFIPEGFAHGFQTLSDNCELIYHHSAAYQKTAEGGIRWDDPAINIQWPYPALNVSQRDQEHPCIEQGYAGIKI
jgi:dTDP-4-dehydrorhamnose 3,5-epimerase